LERKPWLEFECAIYHLFSRGDYRTLPGLVNYIHIPVRAGILSMAGLKGYVFLSYSEFFEKELSRALSPRRFLGALEFADTAKGMKNCEEYLEAVEESTPARNEELTARAGSPTW